MIEGDGAAGDQCGDIDGGICGDRTRGAAIGCVGGGGITGDGESERVTEILVREGDGASGGRNVLSRAVTGNFADGGGVSGAIDRGHVIGTVDGDDYILGICFV